MSLGSNRMGRRWKRITCAAVALVVVGVGGYFAWGAMLENEYDRHVDALRAKGDYEEERESWNTRIELQDNAAEPLRAAANLLARLKEGDDELAGAIDLVVVMGWESDSLDEEDYRSLLGVWPRLNQYFETAAEAGRRAVFAPPPIDVKDANAWCGIQDLCELLKIRAHIDSTKIAPGVQLLLDLADRWRADGAIEMLVKQTVRSEGLEVLHTGLRNGTFAVAEYRGAWDRQLAAVDPVTDLRGILRHSRMDTVRIVEMLRKGEDPYAEVRRRWEEGGLGELPEPPDWYELPLLYENALEMLVKSARAIEHATSLESIRDALDAHSKDDTLKPYYRATLRHLAVLRLARVAMLIQDSGPGGGLEEYAAVWGGRLPDDPFTGEAFSYEARGDTVVISCSAARADAPFEDLLVWEVRWDPAKQGD